MPTDDGQCGEERSREDRALELGGGSARRQDRAEQEEGPLSALKPPVRADTRRAEERRHRDIGFGTGKLGSDRRRGHQHHKHGRQHERPPTAGSCLVDDSHKGEQEGPRL